MTSAWSVVSSHKRRSCGFWRARQSTVRSKIMLPASATNTKIATKAHAFARNRPSVCSLLELKVDESDIAISRQLPSHDRCGRSPITNFPFGIRVAPRLQHEQPPRERTEPDVPSEETKPPS